MAYIQNTKADQTRRYVLKKIQTTLAGLKPSRIAGRFSGPVVLSNSIPKSGTHLIESLLELITPLRNAGVRTFSEHSEADVQIIAGKLLRLKKGAFYNAHIAARREYLDCVSAGNIKALLLVRDPRDIAVSRYRYVTEIDMLHPAHAAFAEAANNTDRLQMAIAGVPGAMPPLAEVFRNFSGWLQSENTLVCKFEDLRGIAGGGSADMQRTVVENVINHLNLSSEDLDVEALINKAFNKGSSTFRKGKIGGWRDEFDDASLAFLRNEFGDAALSFGYDLSVD